MRPSGAVQRNGITAHLDQSLPRQLVAAGQTALAAYSTSRTVPLADDSGIGVRT
ncbi:hypothetical protein AB0N99_39910 [Streptomyces sp. NPDC093272]|uniref:hypothetical protein n=1 Tax=Streptomyces sp. NPDC093272 TaxID=3154981 RepID=UPI00342FBE06